MNELKVLISRNLTTYFNTNVEQYQFPHWLYVDTGQLHILRQFPLRLFNRIVSTSSGERFCRSVKCDWVFCVQVLGHFLGKVQCDMQNLMVVIKSFYIQHGDKNSLLVRSLV